MECNDDYNLNSTLKVNHYSSLLKPDDLWKPVSRINNDRIRRTTRLAFSYEKTDPVWVLN
ncbi:MAG: hypothetical protein ACJ71L_08870 [Nitrososphaeraceae archaeon]